MAKSFNVCLLIDIVRRRRTGFVSVRPTIAHKSLGATKELLDISCHPLHCAHRAVIVRITEFPVGWALRFRKQLAGAVSQIHPTGADDFGPVRAHSFHHELKPIVAFDDQRVDRNLVAERRGDANRLGCAVQLALLRYPGTALAYLDQPTDALVSWMARQLEISAVAFAEYARCPQTMTDSGRRILASDGSPSSPGRSRATYTGHPARYPHWHFSR